MIRKQMIRLAFHTTDSGLRSELLRILVADSKGMQPLDVVEEDETETQKKKKGPPPHWDEFLKAKYSEGKKKVPNTNPKTKDRFHQVTMQTLFKSDEGFKKRVMKEYADWMKTLSESDKKTPSTKKDEKPQPSSKKKPSPKKLSVTFPAHNVESSQIKGGNLDDIHELGVKGATIDHLINLAGGGFSFGSTSKVTVSGQSFEVRGPHIIECQRSIEEDDNTGNPYLYMDVLLLHDSAPKGTGTRMFASSVFQAQKLGIQHVRCQAYRDRSRPEWVGYKVWPKMGYDGVIPLREYGWGSAYDRFCPDLPENLEKSLEEAGFEAPYKVSHLHMVEGGQEWWDENGESFHAEFDTTPGSQSMQVLEAYLKKCMERDGETDLNAWLQKKG